MATQEKRLDALGQDWSDRDYFPQIIRTQQPTYSDILRDGPQGAEAIAAAVPIYGDQGEFLGVLVGMFRTRATSISALYGGIVKQRISAGGEMYLVDGNGQVIYHPDIKRIGDDFSQQPVVSSLLAGESGAFRTKDIVGQEIVAGFAPIPGMTWGMVTEEKWSTLLSGSPSYRQYLSILIVVGVLVPIAFVTFGVRRITQPIEVGPKKMKKHVIKTTEDFENWCETNYWFEDARILKLEPMPKYSSLTESCSLTMELAYQIDGNYKAYSTRLSRVFRLVAEELQEYRLSEDGTYSPEHWSNGIETLEADSAIAFEIDLPSMLTVKCQVVTVEELPNLVETVDPWLSERELYAEIPIGTLPTPAEWLEFFERHKLRVTWHRYGGEPSPKEEVPASDYEGWFLQIPGELDLKSQGIFFFSCKQDGEGYIVQVQNHNASEYLWMATKVILGEFRDATIRSGNCEFSAKEWLEELGR